MNSLTFTIFFLLSFSSLLSDAFPMVPRQLAIPKRAAYSVVAVDGGSATSSPSTVPGAAIIYQTSEQTKTVTAPTVTVSPPAKTLTSTAVISALEPVHTIEVSITKEITRSLAPPSLPAEVSSTPAYTVVSGDSNPTTKANDVYITQISTVSTTLECASSTQHSLQASGSSSILSPSTLILPSTSVSSTGSASVHVISLATKTSPSLAVAVTLLSTATVDTTIQAETTLLPVGLAPLSSSSVTTTTMQPPITSLTYDNGPWHSSYRSWNATLSAPNSYVTATSTYAIRRPHR